MEPPLDVLVVVAHPRRDSLGAALASAVVSAARGECARTTSHDLYADGFDPRLHGSELVGTAFADRLAERYAGELVTADAVIVVHPVWFFGPPAVLKGWVERVVREGVAFDVDSKGAVTGRLRAREALVITTGNAGDATEAALGDPVTRFWQDVVFSPAGVAATQRLALAPVRDSTAEGRADWLRRATGAAAEVVARVRAYRVSHRAEQ